jgi:hypothetical protein
MVYNWESLADAGNTEIEAKERLLRYQINDLCEKKSIDPRRFHIWKAPFKLSKAGPILQGSPSDRDYSDEEQQQLIHILEKGADRSVPLIDLHNCVAHHLSQLRYRVLRIYYLPKKSDKIDIKSELRDYFSQ